MAGDDLYFFIDGEYLRQAFAKAMTRFFGSVPEMNIHGLAQLSQTQPRRTFYYDAIPDDPLSADPLFAQRTAEIKTRQELHRSINALMNFHVREGFVSTGRQRSQKAVDVQLAVDALEHSALHNIGSAIFLLGDLDFQPLLAAMMRFGVRTTVFYEYGSAKEELLACADQRSPLTIQAFKSICPASFVSTHTFPTFNPSAAPGYPNVIKQGTWNGQRAVLQGHGGKEPFELFVATGGDSGQPNIAVHYSGPGEDNPVVAFELAYGPITW